MPFWVVPELKLGIFSLCFKCPPVDCGFLPCILNLCPVLALKK